jgi:hypothetical protein
LITKGGALRSPPSLFPRQTLRGIRNTQRKVFQRSIGV